VIGAGGLVCAVLGATVSGLMGLTSDLGCMLGVLER
jgi:hypothetical protein